MGDPGDGTTGAVFLASCVGVCGFVIGAALMHILGRIEEFLGRVRGNDGGWIPLQTVVWFFVLGLVIALGYGVVLWIIAP